MATRIEQIKLLGSTEYTQQVAGSLLSAAFNVLSEDAATPNHSERIAYAQQILSNPVVQAGAMLVRTLSNPTIAAAAGNPVSESGTPFSDADIDFVVASLFNQMALQHAGL
jgi:hypothetical protein